MGGSGAAAAPAVAMGGAAAAAAAAGGAGMGGHFNAPMNVAAAANLVLASARSPPSSCLLWPRLMCTDYTQPHYLPHLVSLELNGYGNTGLEKLPGSFMSRLRRLALIGVADATPLQVRAKALDSSYR